MSTEELIGKTANTAILAGMSLELIKVLYPQKVYERERLKRKKKKSTRRK